MPLVTVITAARNAESFIDEALDSIRRQTMPDWRMVVVDDASTDSTGERVAAAAAQDARIESLRLDTNVGPYAAANLALAKVDTPYVARIDADDVALPQRFAVQLERLERDARFGACTGAWQLLSDTGEVVGPPRPAPTEHNGFLKWRLFIRNDMPHSTLFARTEALRRYGGYGPEPVAEDFRMWCRLARDGLVAKTDEPVLLWRQSPGQITAAPDSKDRPERLRIRLDHLTTTSPNGGWTIDDARDLRYLGEPAPFSPARATELLDRWHAAWSADRSLGDEDRRALRKYEARLRARHVKHALAGSKVAALRPALGIARVLR